MHFFNLCIIFDRSPITANRYYLKHYAKTKPDYLSPPTNASGSDRPIVPSIVGEVYIHPSAKIHPTAKVMIILEYVRCLSDRCIHLYTMVDWIQCVDQCRLCDWRGCACPRLDLASWRARQGASRDSCMTVGYIIHPYHLNYLELHLYCKLHYWLGKQYRSLVPH